MHSVIVVFLCLFGVVWTKNLPSYITYCKRYDPNLNDCVRRGFEAARPHVPQGIPELRIAPMEPFVIKEMILEQKDAFKIELKNVSFYGASKFQLKEINIDFNKTKFDIKVNFPTLKMQGDYKVKGRLLILSLDGDGPVGVNFTNMETDVYMQGHEYQKDGKTYAHFDMLDLNINPGRPVFRIENLFKDNPELNDQTNKVINDNIDEFIQELRPVMKNALNDLVIGLINQLFERWSLDDLFPK